MRYIPASWRRAQLEFVLRANYNLSPTQDSPVVRVKGTERRIEQCRWGLIPPWSPEFKTKLSTINARAESVFQSRLYKGPALRQRCLVPMSGFIEWKRTPDRKRPFAIHLKDKPIMSMAGIWEAWGSGEAARRSFAIVTTAANGFMSKIHTRMPVILDEAAEQAWLDPENHDQNALQELLRPCPDEWLDADEVSTAINSPRNNSPEVLLPLEAGARAA